MTHQELFIKCQYSNFINGSKIILDDYKKVYLREDYFEKGKLKGFVFYHIVEKTCVIIEACFNTKNTRAFIKCLKKIVKGCESVVWHTEFFNKKMVKLSEGLGAVFLKQEGFNKIYSLKLKENL